MASPPTPPAPPVVTADERTRLLSISFINFAHAIDHYVMLILATVVIELTTVYGWSYAELIALGTPSFLAFGVFSLPAGWLGDRWSRRNMMALFYFGCGASLVGVALAAGTTALLVYGLGWRGAFLVPALVCIATGIAYLLLIPDDRHKTAGRTSTPEVVFTPWLAAAIFAL